ncbi:MAG TPA: 50S ribosomal protein L25 [Candidatus Marinimicrobia bacterium]|nr:50S ribosomal protein L25 [Candidatus Neomarinimicrobiota bacterium]
MADYNLKSELRTNTYKGVTKLLRKQEKIPAVYYFHREKPITLSVDLKALKAAIHSGASIYEIQIGNKKHKCILRNVQYNPVTEEIIHADFMGITMKEDINVNVPIHLEGTAIGVKDFDGVLAQQIWELNIKCKAGDIPDVITIDVTGLNIGDSISVADISIENVEIITPATSSIVSVIKATGAKAEEEAAEEAEEPEETEETTE